MTYVDSVDEEQLPHRAKIGILNSPCSEESVCENSVRITFITGQWLRNLIKIHTTSRLQNTLSGVVRHKMKNS